MPQLTAEYTTALVRGLISAIVLGGIAFLTSLSTGSDTRAAAINGGLIALGTLAARTGVEGTVDSNRAKGGA